VEQSLTLKYVVWLGIHAQRPPGPGRIRDSISVRLQKVHEYERRWRELTPFATNTIDGDIHCEGSPSRMVELGWKRPNVIQKCILPSREDTTPPFMGDKINLRPYRSEVRAWDAYEDVLIMLIRCFFSLYYCFRCFLIHLSDCDREALLEALSRFR
jgi:hypothetical protein